MLAHLVSATRKMTCLLPFTGEAVTPFPLAPPLVESQVHNSQGNDFTTSWDMPPDVSPLLGDHNHDDIMSTGSTPHWDPPTFTGPPTPGSSFSGPALSAGQMTNACVSCRGCRTLGVTPG